MTSSPAIAAKAVLAKGITRQFPIPSCSLGVDDLDRLFRILQKKASEAADEQVAGLQQQAGQTAQQFNQGKESLRSLLNLVVRVQGTDGEWTAANTADPIREDSLPLSIASIQYDSSFLFRGQFNTYPQNNFLVTLDFTRTGILDLTNLSAAPGPNQSDAVVSGVNITWVNAVTQELRAFFEQRSAARGWLYSPYAYDLLVLTIGFPVSFNLVYHFDKILRPVLKLPDALFVALYVYLVLVVLLGFRLIFNYAKWVLPKIEGPSRRHGAPRLHKTILAAVALTLMARLITSFLWILGIHLH
jgi:hypothetical protein